MWSIGGMFVLWAFLFAFLFILTTNRIRPFHDNRSTALRILTTWPTRLCDNNGEGRSLLSCPISTGLRSEVITNRMPKASSE